MTVETEPQLIKATKTAHGYLASPLSDHISEMPDGSLLVVGCPIARTGFQSYAVRDLPQEAAQDLGIDIRNPSASIDLYRPPEEVFSPEFLASLNGRPITDGHPPGFVDPSNFALYAKGHIQNPRKGPEPLEDGEWPIIADLVISGEPLVTKVRNKMARDVSLGYDYSIERDGDRIIQCGMTGNHCAVVPKGRAGDLVSIGDAAPPGPEASPPGPGAGHAVATDNVPQPKKEKRTVKNSLLHMLGLGFKARAADADVDPEELAQAAMDIGRHAKDLDPEIEETEQVKDRKGARDKKSRDLDPEIEETEPAMDAGRRKMHDALDRMIDAKGRDADIEELKSLLNEFLSEEEAEPEHAQDDEEEELDPVDPSPLEEVLENEAEEGAEDDEPCDCGDPECPGCDAEEEVDPGTGEENLDDEEPEEEPRARDRAKAADAASRSRAKATAHDGALATLRMIRPAIAKDAGPAATAAFNAALAAVTRGSRTRATDAGYSRFGTAARTRSAKTGARAADAAADANAKLQEYYDARRKEGK